MREKENKKQPLLPLPPQQMKKMKQKKNADIHCRILPLWVKLQNLFCDQNTFFFRVEGTTNNLCHNTEKMPLAKKQHRKGFWFGLSKCNVTFTCYKPEVNVSSLLANAGYGQKLSSSVPSLNSAPISRHTAVSKWFSCWDTWTLCLSVLDLLKHEKWKKPL